jgi:hypothetical protein
MESNTIFMEKWKYVKRHYFESKQHFNKSLTKEANLFVEGFEKIPEDGSKYFHGKIKYNVYVQNIIITFE